MIGQYWQIQMKLNDTCAKKIVYEPSFLILPSKKYQTLRDELIFYLAYVFESWQITKFTKYNLANSWRCSRLTPIQAKKNSDAHTSQNINAKCIITSQKY